MPKAAVVLPIVIPAQAGISCRRFPVRTRCHSEASPKNLALPHGHFDRSNAKHCEVEKSVRPSIAERQPVLSLPKGFHNFEFYIVVLIFNS
jgi:hypothetical protein